MESPIEDLLDNGEVDHYKLSTQQEDTAGEEESAYNEHFKHSELRAGPGVRAQYNHNIH